MTLATSYRYQVFDAEFGPVSFKKLVALVRDGTLGTDDLVQPDWSTDWQPAATIVGLFHMAGRQDVLEAWEQERADSPDVGTFPGDSGEAGCGTDQPRWQKGLREVEEQQRIAQMQQQEEGQAVLQASREAELRSRIISEALEQIDRCAGRRFRDRMGLWRKASSSLSLKSSLRWVTAIVAANLTAIWILNWSATQLQRYPDLRLLQSGAKVFPFMGTCSHLEYQILLIDTMVVAGVLVYLASGIAVAMADD